jgi:hypothetical protein
MWTNANGLVVAGLVGTVVGTVGTVFAAVDGRNSSRKVQKVASEARAAAEETQQAADLIGSHTHQLVVVSRAQQITEMEVALSTMLAAYEPSPGKSPPSASLLLDHQRALWSAGGKSAEALRLPVPAYAELESALMETLDGLSSVDAEPTWAAVQRLRSLAWEAARELGKLPPVP